MDSQHDPLRFLSHLFEITVWPFQAASRYSANRLPLHDQRPMMIMLFPAMMLFPLLCLLISLVAIAYVFFVLPFIYVCERITRLLGL